MSKITLFTTLTTKASTLQNQPLPLNMWLRRLYFETPFYLSCSWEKAKAHKSTAGGFKNECQPWSKEVCATGGDLSCTVFHPYLYQHRRHRQFCKVPLTTHNFFASTPSEVGRLSEKFSTMPCLLSKILFPLFWGFVLFEEDAADSLKALHHSSPRSKLYKPCTCWWNPILFRGNFYTW